MRMKRVLLLTLLSTLFLSYAAAQYPAGDDSVEFTEEEKAKANTAKDCAYMLPIEREVIYVLNLARTSPKKFAEKYIRDFKRNRYMFAERCDSLYRQLKHMEPINALLPEPELTAHAQCFAEQSGKIGAYSHSREGTTCLKRFNAECIVWGDQTAVGYVCNLLVDYGKGNEALGHRRAMLNKDNIYIGVGQGDHKDAKTKKAVVLNFWKNLRRKNNYTYIPQSMKDLASQKPGAVQLADNGKKPDATQPSESGQKPDATQAPKPNGAQNASNDDPEDFTETITEEIIEETTEETTEETIIEETTEEIEETTEVPNEK